MPHAKVVFLMREPVSRTVSAYSRLQRRFTQKQLEAAGKGSYNAYIASEAAWSAELQCQLGVPAKANPKLTDS